MDIVFDPFLTEMISIELELKNMPQQAADLMREISSINRELRSFSKNARTSQELQQKQNLILRRNKIEDELRQQPERRHELEKDYEAYCKASDCFLRTFHDADVHSKVEIITNNFVADSIKHFAKLDSIKFYKRTICQETGISKKTFLLDDWFWRSTPEGSGILKHQLELYTWAVSEYFDCEGPTLWLICYHLILDTVIELLAEQWVALYPQFKSINDKKLATEEYVKLGHTPKTNESMQFICWLYDNAFLQGNFIVAAQSVEEDIVELQKDNELASFKRKMLSNRKETEEKRITMDDIDDYSGTEFEQFVGHLFILDGYQVGYTLASNDKGIDVIARRNGISIGIQCKRYGSTVGIEAVQEVFAGKSFYSLDKAMVVTNSTFTKAAIDLAEATGVILWDRNVIDSKMKLVQ